ncbi:TetR-like C-terminal domain-containing protein [Streptomyces sp. BB1-1-1]|uniref:TetR-like C-terminal domain-containing protein n=1 Tax=Streptomyces sp. BB1-1-1 TaxID=3074430 RepID=UPI002877CA54|nr:TetR-like C-terminal domain-containing protein [Streptomyces sp. BB1-1-1]WND40146.1 TetR-like C-terminal domain-containing protein [Streptomyces sp. BB1-1-1]
MPDTDTDTDPGGRLLAWGQALREWALAHPESFRLFYGHPIPGYQPLRTGRWPWSSRTPVPHSTRCSRLTSGTAPSRMRVGIG